MMSSEKEQLVLEYCRSPSISLRDEIVMKYRPLVQFIARKFSYNIHDLEDLIQVGTISLMRTLERFDPEKKVDFSTFATPNIIGEIKHYFRDKNRLVKTPRKLQELCSKVKGYIRQCQGTGHSPTIPEIAQHLDVDEEHILEAMEVGQTSMVVSLDSPNYKSNSGGDMDSGSTILDTIGVESREDSLLSKETIKNAIDHLKERERKVVYLRYYCGLSQTEIANEMNLSQMHISRLLSKSLGQLKKILADHHIG